MRFTEIYDLINSGAQIIDVREDIEYANGHLKNTISIPMSRIRQELDKIDKTKPVYVHCKTGQRSYNITLMLKSKGYDAYNVAGSFDFITSYEKDMCRVDATRQNIFVTK